MIAAEVKDGLIKSVTPAFAGMTKPDLIRASLKNLTGGCMHKFYFSIKTRGGLTISRLMIAGRNQDEAERKLNQMYRHCKIISCESSYQSSDNKGPNAFVEGNYSFLAKQESPTGKYPHL